MSAHYMARINQWVNEKLLFNITCKFVGFDCMAKNARNLKNIAHNVIKRHVQETCLEC